MRTWLAAVVLAAMTGLAGCGPSHDDCKSEVLNPQGEPYRCIASEDCPRSGNETLCITDVGAQEECIRCEATQCVRITPAEDCS